MDKLKEKVGESLTSVLPVTMIVLFLSIVLVPVKIEAIAMFLVGAVLLIIGMGFFQLGAEMSMTPLGQGIGGQLVKKRKLPLIICGCFLMGTLITISEPDLQVLANQVASIPNSVLILSVAIGVGLFLVTAVLRILYKIPITYLLIGMYLILLVLAMVAPSEFLAVAFDAGGVTTGPMTVPFIMALGIGLSASRSDKNSASDSFGLIALSSVGPDGTCPGHFLSSDGCGLYDYGYSQSCHYAGCCPSICTGDTTVRKRSYRQYASDHCGFCGVSGLYT